MAKLHAQALKGIPFLEFLNRQIQGSTTAKELIFSPFKSEFFAENDQGILRSLFTAHTTLADENLVEITCRGHSAKVQSCWQSLFWTHMKWLCFKRALMHPYLVHSSKR